MAFRVLEELPIDVRGSINLFPHNAFIECLDMEGGDDWYHLHVSRSYWFYEYFGELSLR